VKGRNITDRKLVAPWAAIREITAVILALNQPFYACADMTFVLNARLAAAFGSLLVASAWGDFHFSTLRICIASILGIVLAITSHMHRLVLEYSDRADLSGATAQCIVGHANPSVAAGNLQGGRWTKDRCGGDQQWRTRLSGRGWTDRRRSG